MIFVAGNKNCEKMAKNAAYALGLRRLNIKPSLIVGAFDFSFCTEREEVAILYAI